MTISALQSRELVKFPPVGTLRIAPPSSLSSVTRIPTRRPFPVITPFVNPSTFQTIYSTSCEFKAASPVCFPLVLHSCIGTHTLYTGLYNVAHSRPAECPGSTNEYGRIHLRTRAYIREPTSRRCHRCTPRCISMKQVQSELVGPRLLRN